MHGTLHAAPQQRRSAVSVVGVEWRSRWPQYEYEASTRVHGIETWCRSTQYVNNIICSRSKTNTEVGYF